MGSLTEELDRRLAAINDRVVKHEEKVEHTQGEIEKRFTSFDLVNARLAKLEEFVTRAESLPVAVVESANIERIAKLEAFATHVGDRLEAWRTLRVEWEARLVKIEDGYDQDEAEVDVEGWTVLELEGLESANIETRVVKLEERLEKHPRYCLPALDSMAFTLEEWQTLREVLLGGQPS